MSSLFLTYGEADRIKAKYPGRIPIFITKSSYVSKLSPVPLILSTLSISIIFAKVGSEEHTILNFSNSSVSVI